MEARTTTKMKATISAVLTHADGTVEDLGIIAQTADDDAPKPGLMRILKDAWVEGWDAGKEKKGGA